MNSKRLRSSLHAFVLLLLALWSSQGVASADASAAPATKPASDPVKVCWDAFEPAEWGKISDCLKAALTVQEAALAQALSVAEKQAAETMDKLSAKKTLDASQAQWKKYRDAECDRQLAFVAGRNHPDIGELTCRIRKTADRIADLHFDEE